ncbi:hypothetical protein BKA65DRAFT_558877 [Rhexocercosporidium sp. MPI-PUGE-AT-0058]|nr:hypothetical protein BKA65DRAFT_558877 [Rhexocercosporidium sp. MPI-PUGE-AT-0058]
MEIIPRPKNNAAPKPRTMTRLQALLSTLPPITLSTRPTPLKEFSLFPKLPAELRNKVWKHATQVYRKVKIFELNTISTEKGWDSRVEGQIWIPGIIHASRESRHEGCKVYKRCYETSQPYLGRQELERAGAGRPETGLARTEDDLTENERSPQEEESEVVASRRTCLYINFDRDLFIMVPYNQTSDTHEAAIAWSLEDFARPIPTKTIAKGAEIYTLNNDDFGQIQHFEQTFQNMVAMDVGFLAMAPIQQFTLAYKHHSLENGDNVGGDLARCDMHCKFERVVRKILRVIIKMEPKVPSF